MWNHVMGDRSTRVTPRSSPTTWAAWMRLFHCMENCPHTLLPRTINRTETTIFQVTQLSLDGFVAVVPTYTGLVELVDVARFPLEQGLVHDRRHRTGLHRIVHMRDPRFTLVQIVSVIRRANFVAIYEYSILE